MEHQNIDKSCEKDEIESDEHTPLTHEELLRVTKVTVNELLKTDPVLGDLPPDVTLEEVEAQLAVLHGQSITVNVKRGENDDLPVIIKQKNSTVSDLKRAFQRALELKLRRQGQKRKIGWKYVWRVYTLSCDGCKLYSDHGLLKDYGIVNKSNVSFVLK